MPIRAVIYVRYSSENQREASIEDQVRLCRERSELEGWELAGVFHDAAVSGGSTFRRRGYNALLEGAQSGRFEVVVAEALDRLSRDQEDVAALFKQMQFAGIKIITLAEGEISALHVGLKGTMNACSSRIWLRKPIVGCVDASRQGNPPAGDATVTTSCDAPMNVARFYVVNGQSIPTRRPSCSASSACSPRVRAPWPSRRRSTKRVSPAPRGVPGGTRRSVGMRCGELASFAMNSTSGGWCGTG